MRNKFKLIFFGSDSFSIQTLNPILEKYTYNVEVVTKKHSDLDGFAKHQNLTTHYWCDKFSEKIKRVNDDKPAIGLVSSFGSMIDPETVQTFKYGLFNVHPSLLPKYRGSSPVQYAILNGDVKTGVSIFQIPPVKKFDIGDIVLQEIVRIKPGEYAYKLAERLAKLGSQMLINLINNYDDQISRKKPQQLTDCVSYAKKLTPEMGKIEFKHEESHFVDQKVRAFTNYIELYFYWLGRKFQVHKMLNPEKVDCSFIEHSFLNELSRRNLDFELEQKLMPGQMIYSRRLQALCVKCFDSQWIAFESIKVEARPWMNAREFQNGYLSKFDYNIAVID